MEEISNVEAIVELILKDARSRTKVDHSKAIMEVVGDVIVRCNEILNQVPFYEREIKPDENED